jgi:S-adenosylmethionine:tRNA ribosyltransferase-isomerase
VGVEPRDSSRLLVAQRGGLDFKHRRFFDLPEYLRAGDLLVLNESRVIPARLEGRKPTGGTVEAMLLRELTPLRWSAYLKPARRVAMGGQLDFGPAGTPRVSARIVGVLEDGARVLEFERDVKPHLDEIGAVPLPPYITAATPAERYQTVYAREPGSVAAPTAGLHFTPELLQRVEGMGVGITRVTLHVGAGTFKPIAGSIEEHVMHGEEYFVPEEAASAVNTAKAEGRRVVAVGTTAVRTLESAWTGSGLRPGGGETALFIRPGYRYQVVDALVTNFHLPRSTLLLLVAAFAGYDTMRAAYDTALAGDYRFYSLGDAMLIH